MFETAIRYLVDSDDRVETTLLGGILTLFSWLVVPAVLVAGYLQRVLAVEDRLGAAFEFRKLSSVLASGSYATGWLIALVVLVVGGSLVGGLASIPFLGWALIPFAAFYVNVVAFALYGQGYRDATAAGRRRTVGSDRQSST